MVSERRFPLFQRGFSNTLKFLNFRTQENFTVIYIKIRTKRPNLKVFSQKDANGIAIIEDPDQTASLDLSV